MDLGLIPYEQAYQKQQEAVASVGHTGKTELFFCEHPAVITLGRMSRQEHLLASEAQLQAREVGCVAIDRGGDITLHAPGQLVIYPIVDLKRYKQDLHWYLHTLEDITCAALQDFGLSGGRLAGKTGVYTEGRKIASIGIGVRKWIAYHGVGINVATDLSLFSLIKPCGLDVAMTSMTKELGRPVDREKVKQSWQKHFQGVFHG